MNKEGVFPRRIEAYARKALSKYIEHIEPVIESLASRDLIVETPKSLFTEGTLAAAAVGLKLAEDNSLTLGFFSATSYMDLVTRPEDQVQGFETARSMMDESDLIVVSDLSMVSAKIAHEIDGYLMRRWNDGHQSILSGYNVQETLTHTGETIDGYSGYPLLASRVHRSCLYWSPGFFPPTRPTKVRGPRKKADNG